LLASPDERAFGGGGQEIGLAHHMYAPKGPVGNASNVNLEKGRSQVP
jgi:hypothetical protein